MKNSGSFHIFAQNIDCRYSLEPPRRGGSNEYPQSMFLSRNKNIIVFPFKPQFYCIKVGFKGSKLYRRVFVMKSNNEEKQFWPDCVYAQTDMDFCSSHMSQGPFSCIAYHVLTS